MATPVVLSGSINSNSWPSGPSSSANTIVPHGVMREGSQLSSPDTTIVSTSPSEIRIRWTPGSGSLSSLHVISQVGFVSFGQSAIMSVFGPAFGSAVTT
jgi:hypothetical protein